MFGFPVNLQDSGVQKFTNDADSGFPKIQQREVFYSVKDGLWNDTSIWQTASGRVGLLPTINDDVYIRNIVSIFSPPTISVRNLYISGNLLFTNGSVVLSVNNIFCDTGILDMTVGSQLNIRGNESRVNKDRFIIGTATTIAYIGDIDQNVLNLNYRNLTINSTIKSNKTLISDITLLGNLHIGSLGGDVTFELSSYNLTVNGNLTLGGGSGGGRLRKSASGNVTFIGTMGLSANGIDFSGNPNVEMRGGGTFGTILNTGTGTWTFTTNNQSINVSSTTTANCNFIIGSGVTVNFFNNSALNLNKTINGTDSTSKLLMGGTSNSLNFATLESVDSMTTGIVDFTTNANTIGYTGNYSATIPSYFTTFHNLTISGTGTKSLGVNTTLNGNYAQYGNASSFSSFEMGSYNFYVGGTTLLSGQQNQLSISFKKSGTGNLTFVGQMEFTGNNAIQLDFAGNPNIECRNGMNLGPYGWNLFNSGTGTWTFSTNNQEIFGSYNTTNFAGPVLISGPITLTIRSISGVQLYVNILNSINGNNALSKLFIGGGTTQIAYLGITNSTPIMSTGIFDFTTSTYSGISYQILSAYTLPYNNFQHLQVYGSGKKSLSANTTINGTFLVDGEFDALNYDLSINGNTLLNAGILSILRKTGIGNITFGGSLQASTQNTTIDFSGNPNVEFKNGFTQGSQVYTSFNSGTGIWKFSTNNQSMGGNFFIVTLNCQILISGGITLTLLSLNGTPTFTNVINGDNVNSKFLMSSSSNLTYNAATQPMATGILDTSTNLNTWIYGNSNQDIKGGPSTLAKQVYRNLTLNGGGTKTLQGYVSVLNTYTLTSPATLANNGFTLTNP